MANKIKKLSFNKNYTVIKGRFSPKSSISKGDNSVRTIRVSPRYSLPKMASLKLFNFYYTNYKTQGTGPGLTKLVNVDFIFSFLKSFRFGESSHSRRFLINKTYPQHEFKYLKIGGPLGTVALKHQPQLTVFKNKLYKTPCVALNAGNTIININSSANTAVLNAIFFLKIHKYLLITTGCTKLPSISLFGRGNTLPNIASTHSSTDNYLTFTKLVLTQTLRRVPNAIFNISDLLLSYILKRRYITIFIRKIKKRHPEYYYSSLSTYSTLIKRLKELPQIGSSSITRLIKTLFKNTKTNLSNILRKDTTRINKRGVLSKASFYSLITIKKNTFNILSSGGTIKPPYHIFNLKSRLNTLGGRLSPVFFCSGYSLLTLFNASTFVKLILLNQNRLGVISSLFINLRLKFINTDKSSKTLSFFNLIPDLSFNRRCVKGISSSSSNLFLKENIVPWVYTNLLRFVEYSYSRKAYLQVYSFMNQSLDLRFILLYKRWLPRLTSFERKLGHRFFLEESLHIFHLSFNFYDPDLLISWLKSLIKRISFWKTRLIFRFIKYLFNNYYFFIFEEIGLKGFKLKLKGKISVAGNSRKRSILYRIGKTTHSTVGLRSLHTKKIVNTFTGVLGLQVWLFY